ncbi:thioredoxin-2 [Microplitis mediator]|uniref:thioredoxin-2 n=1 Tax=Microplitis mediator TaxID=375433 RepID=UPI002552921E|nr:thioredoxin-2 [Microplitis mediator]
MAIHIKDLADLKKRIDEAGDKLLVVDFHATWCGPCKVIGPKFEELATIHEDVIFVKVDVDECEEIATVYEVSSMPTFKFFKKGKPVETIVGASEAKLKEAIEKLK